MSNDIFIGRQPIYDNDLRIQAYELLFRNSQTNSADVVDGDAATSQVINTLIDFGLENLVGDRPAYINFTRAFLLGEYPIPFTTEPIVIEVLEDIEVDDEMIRSVQQLSEQGYTIALDDFVYEPRLKPLVSLASIVKVDCLIHDRDSLRRQVASLKQFPVKLLAEKVETHDEFEFCKELGFDLYQGYFLAKPRLVQGQRIPTNKLAILDLLAKLRDPAVRIVDLEETIRNDVALSYKLLRYVNSSAFAIRRKIESVQQAIVLLGLECVRKMVTLIALSGMDDKPLALTVTAVLRARMCELLAEALGRDDSEMFFTAGLFSTLDVLMDSSMSEIVKELPLSNDLQNALVANEGVLGSALSCVISCELGEWDDAHCLTLEPSQIRHASMEAIRWVEAGEGMAGLLANCKEPAIAEPQTAAI
jgi:EAL and modified HD-GYP domain-containing signal transduction protein